MIFVNSRFLRLAGLASDDEAIRKNCRILLDDKAQSEQGYLTEELAQAVRTRSPVLVKLQNKTKAGRSFQNLVAMQPVVMTEDGEYFYQIGLQVNVDDKPHVVDQKLVDMELFLSLLPHTIDTTSAHDVRRLLPPPMFPMFPTNDGDAVVNNNNGDLPPEVDDDDANAGNNNVSSHDNRRRRLATERASLEAIVQFTAVRWLAAPQATAELLLRQGGPCRDAFAAFAKRWSRVAAALVRGFDLCDDLLCTATVLEQKALALKYHAAWTENPLFLFTQTEIPVGSLSNIEFNWEPILNGIPKLLERCVKVLSVHVLPDFLRSDDARTMVAALLAHPSNAISIGSSSSSYQRNGGKVTTAMIPEEEEAATTTRTTTTAEDDGDDDTQQQDSEVQVLLPHGEDQRRAPARGRQARPRSPGGRRHGEAQRTCSLRSS